MSGIFGGKKAQSSSQSDQYNKSYDFIKDTYSPLTGYAGSGLSALSALLGGDSSGFDAFKQATGFDAAADLGSRGITGNAAAAGLLRSGSTGKALQNYGETLQNQYASNYMDKLLAQAQAGFNAGNLISGAGQVGTSTSQSTSKENGGLGGLLGTALAGAQLIGASDKRLKTNITKVGNLSNGLGLYSYNYINGKGPYIGVLAQEVEELMPEALGPIVDGYMTVDYGKIREIV